MVMVVVMVVVVGVMMSVWDYPSGYSLRHRIFGGIWQLVPPYR